MLQQVEIVEIGRSTAMAWVHRQSKWPGEMKGLPADRQWRDDRYLSVGQLLGEAVFFDNGGVAPAIWPIELHNDRRAVFDPNLVNPILVTVEREKSTVAAVVELLKRVENLLRLQCCISQRRTVWGFRHGSRVLVSAAMTITSRNLLFGAIAFLLVACGNNEPPLDTAAYEADIMEWREGRFSSLMAPDGYLTLVGLYWLEKDSVRIGSAADNDFQFPGNAAEHIGLVQITESGLKLTVEPGVDVRNDDVPVQSILVRADTSADPVLLTHGSLAWMAIERDGKYAIRLRDYESPALETFQAPDYFPIDPDLRVSGTLRAFDEPKIMNVDTVIEGLGYRPESPGKIAFDIDGETFELEAYESGDSLFFVFGDKTSGRETYPAGRFLYSSQPDEDGKTVLDFNKAYSPPCAFNSFATCPVASPRNRLPVRIEAGEKFDPTLYEALEH